MNERALNIYHSTFLVELTKENSIEKTYGFVVNEGTQTEHKLVHYIQGDVTAEGITRVRMIFNYNHEDHPVERSVSGKFISQTFVYDTKNGVSIGELPIDVAGEIVQQWF